MGKRKERRLAAKASSGRRVKLDLFLDPPPGEASVKQGVGGENRELQTGVPTSPSSSDKKENPLALLGQYSDDEEEEGAVDQPIGEAKGSPTDAITKVIQDQDASGDKGTADIELPASIGVQQEVSQADDVKIFTENVPQEITVVPEPTPENECVTATEAIPDSSGMQIVGDIGGNWKAIMHEQSNQYYYWNTITGETSWEIPNALASGVSTDGVASASVPTHMEYSVEAHAHVLPHSNGEAYPNDVSVGNGTATYSSMGMVCGSGELTHSAYAYTGAVAGHESVNIDPLQLAKFGEDLLQRLKLLERPHVAIDSIELIKREIEMRISDCNALSSYGSSLLPLWLHAEVHLKHLELSVSMFEASYTTKPGYLETADAEYKAPNEAEVMADENVKVEEPCSTSLVQNPQEGAAAVVSKVESESDEDMDVEMEVDEESVEEQGGPASVPNEEHPSSEQVRSPTLPSLDDSAPPPQDDGITPPPPPPEEEWIPPPPPENEQAPPPPPEPEEPVVSYAQADTLPQPYVDQANLGYMLPGVAYYPAVGSDGTNANYYMQVSESHILQSQQHSYYAPVSTSSIPIPVDATSVPPVPGSYYGYPSVTMAATEVAAESSGYYASSTSAISSGALDGITTSASVVDTNSNVNPMESDKVISKEPTIAPFGQSVGAASASGTTVHGGSTQASASTTNQTKVPRTKKRPVAVASSLRSNKKVSSLVDKWKAAKEELRDEEEDEPEDALEAFERKRRKEIDGWRKQQIASGEAKENANFVPLGGDWRDRVKRKRKEAKKESKAESVAAAEQHKGQPDLTELSKGLPSGWQAYIDESTKQVYYGNSLTSETSWDRPGK
ncbi:formin-binding protein 4 isoform X1 [Lolium rigidum]|uniref:formin-binding protein 4 isoform X1 n=1 Tax=Lolium rigidum TaxID=89674 RepID=UPI001F5E2328|nr:formin-binding protein 4 isoform X1 [Lolium rigidum]